MPVSPEIEWRIFRDGYAEGRADASNNRPRQHFSGELGAGYTCGWVGEIEPEAAYRKWCSFGRPE